jgi:hypothetical protein
MATPVSGASAWLTINNKPLSFEPNNENQHLNIAEYSTNSIRITPNAPDSVSISIDEQELETARYKRYQQGQIRRPYTMGEVIRSAYILYPGNKIHSESKHGSIGSLPLIPNMSPQRLDEVREQLKDLLYSAHLID